MPSVHQWFRDESGFQIFESTALAWGAFMVALVVVGYIVSIASGEYTRVENEFIGSEIEADETLQRFH
ncbi:hypothetical protein ACFYU8_18375 [Brevibacillus sp. NPDC003359]|uniref:hypothetical protein n=1 Tax=unclassified Brevibacillus TaxID=2684853 RepID=UPI0036A5B720